MHTLKFAIDNDRARRLARAAKRLKLQEDRLARRYFVAGMDAQAAPAPAPVHPPPPVIPPPVEPPPVEPGNEDGWIGGAIGRGGKSRIVKGQRITSTLPADTHDVDFVDCSADGIHLFGEQIGRNVRWLGGTIDRMRADPRYGKFGVYINVGYEPFPLNFVIQRAKCRDWKGLDWKFEMKASFYALVDNVFEAGQGAGIRLRHGEHNVVSGNVAFGSVSLRDNLNMIVGNAGGLTTAWAGRIPGGYLNWKDLHNQGSGNNYQSAVDNFIARGNGNQRAEIGVPSGGDGQYHQRVALRNCLDPAARSDATLRFEEGTWTGSLGDWNASRSASFRGMAVIGLSLDELLALPPPPDETPDDDDDLAALEAMIAHADEDRRLAS